MLLQHRGYGDGSSEMEAREVHRSLRAMDDGAKIQKDIRSGLSTSIFAGICRQNCSSRAQVEPTWTGR